MNKILKYQKSRDEIKGFVVGRIVYELQQENPLLNFADNKLK
jgi:hypothetical protein